MRYGKGDTYTIVEDGERKIGKVVQVHERGYTVKWDDGEFTEEPTIDPWCGKR